MKKSILNWSLAAVLLCGAGLSFTACSDDDDDENSTEQRSDMDPLDTDEARVAWRWINQLTDETEFSDSWKTKTYEVTAGQESSQNALWRIIVVKSLDEAKKDFSLLADMDARQLGTKQTVNGGAAGTMTWTPSAANAKNLAEVAVSSRLFPKLQKIVYCTEAQVGDNGLIWDSMKGTAYYRYGDVIKDPEGYYWVCIRPAFKPDNKKSHWINIFNAAASGGSKAIPTGYLQTKWNNLAKYNNQTIVLPTKLPYDREKIHEAANFFWALTNIDAYKDACLKNNSIGLGGFPYINHGENFLKTVAAYWDEKGPDGYTIWQKVFNCTHQEMASMKQMDFFYSGYSWIIGNSGYCYRYTSKGYESEYYGSESDDKEKFDFVNGGFDLRYYAHTPGDDVKALPFTNFTVDADRKMHGMWVIRHKTGAELMTSGSYSPYQQLTAKNGGQTDVYVFNKRQGVDAGENIQPVEDSAVKSTETALADNYCIGDYVLDLTDNSRWICVRSSAGEASGKKHALFVSFDGIKTYDNADRSASNILTEAEACEVGYYLAATFQGFYLQGTHNAGQPLAESYMSQAGVNFNSLFAKRDSIVHVNVDNQTHSINYNIAYNNGSRDKQPIMRYVLDGSRLLVGDRGKNGQNDAYTRHRLYKHYQKWDGTKDWSGDWTMSSQAMYLGDVADQALVNSYSTDKWVKLPLSEGSGKSGKRTTADADGWKVSRYLYKNGAFADPTALGMYNEPVLFMRSMWVEDKKIVAENGHKLRVVNHVPQNYGAMYGYTWYIAYDDAYKNYSYVDNVFKQSFTLTK